MAPMYPLFGSTERPAGESSIPITVSVDKAVAVVAEMPDIVTPFTSCSCSHSRHKTPSPVSSMLDVNGSASPDKERSVAAASTNAYASALAPTIMAAQRVHARMEQCREWANVVASAARDAEHAPGTGASNPYARQLTTFDASVKKKAKPHPGPLSHVHGPPGSPSTKPNPNMNNNMNINLDDYDRTTRLSSPPHQEEETSTAEAYPPTTPAKWYDDPVADARSRSGSRAVSRANTPPRATAGSARAASMGRSTSAASMGMGMGMSRTGTGTNTSVTVTATLANTHLQPVPLIAVANGRAGAKRQHQHDEDPSLSVAEPEPKRRSAPTSPAPAHPTPRLQSVSPDAARPRPLLNGTIASRTGPALAQVRAAFASVGVESGGVPSVRGV